MAARLGLANPPTPCECKPRTVPDGPDTQQLMETKSYAETRDRTGDLQIFSLTLSQLSYRGYGHLPNAQTT